MNKHEAARLMHGLPDEARDDAIAAADNVHDLRPYCEERRKQRAIAEAYRRPKP